MSRPEYIVLVAIAIILAAAGFDIYEYTVSPTISIRKNEWRCTKSALRTTLAPMWVGSNVVLLPQTESVCVEYSRTGP